MICYSCGEEGHLASQCPKVHFCTESKSKIIDKFLKEEVSFRKTYQRRSKRSFSPRKELELLATAADKLRSTLGNPEAALLQTQEHEYYINFCGDEFNEILELQIYLPYFQKFGFIPAEGAPIESVGSADTLNNINGKANQGTTLQPPQLTRGSSKEKENQNLLGHDLFRQNSKYARQSSIANGIVGSQGQGLVPQGSRQFPRQNSLPPTEQQHFTRFRFDIVENFEVYYPHGNITVISKKYNVLAIETMAALTIERRAGKKINRNILKGIDILSGGSIYGAIKKSSESLMSIKSPAIGGRRKTLLTLDSPQKHNSFFSANVASSSLQISSADPSSIEAKNKSVLSPIKKEGSFFLNPERLNESSVVSSSSVIIHPSNEATESVTTTKRRPSRFGPNSLQISQVTSSNPLASNSQKASNSNLIALHEDRTVSYGPSSFDHNVASSILPRSNEVESSSNNNLINFWKEKERSKSSFQKSDVEIKSGSMSFASPRFRKLSAEDSRSQFDSRLHSDSFGDGDDSRSQMSQVSRIRGNRNQDSTSSQKYSSDKKVVQTHLRRALRSLKENSGSTVSEKKVPQKKSRFSQRSRAQRPRSVGQESKLERMVKREGMLKTLKDMVVIIQADKRLFAENVLGKTSVEAT